MTIFPPLEEDPADQSDGSPSDATKCAVLETSTKIQALSKDMVKAIRQLRRDLLKCQDCTGCDDCPILDNLNSTITAALQDVWDVWGLAQNQESL